VSKILSLIVACATALAIASPAAADFFDERVFARIYTQTPQDREIVSNMDFAIDTVDLTDGSVEAWVPKELLPKIENLGFLVDVIETEAWKGFPNGYGDYHDYAEQNAALQALAVERPDITDLFTYGKSIEGKDLYCLKISDNPLQDQLDKPATIIVAMHHAREILSPEVALDAATWLVEGYETDEQLTAYVHDHEIFVCPNINPDGGEFDHQGGNFHMWRKNRRHNQGGSYGVDLNRNYGYKWGGVGSSDYPGSETYHGTGPFSEPETAACRDLVKAHENITTLLTLHTHAKLVLFPWGYTYQHIQDQTDYRSFSRLARLMAAELEFTPSQSSGLYPTTGDTTDWAYGVRGIFAFTFELSPSQLNPLGFYPSPSMIEPQSLAAFEAIKILIGFARDPHNALSTELWKLTATPQGDDGALIEWASVRENQPKGYQVLRAASEDGTYEKITGQNIPPNGERAYSYADSGLAAGQTYYYKVKYLGAGDGVEFGPAAITMPGGGDDDDDNDDASPGGDDDAADDDAAGGDDDDDSGGCGC
jgi:hypothetical protein